MTTKELKAMQPAGGSKTVLKLTISSLAAMFLVFVLMMRYHHEPSVGRLMMIIALVSAVIIGGIIWIRLALKQSNAAQKAFFSEDVYVERDDSIPLRNIEKLAVERFGGNLKQALVFAAISPELSRKERRDMANGLMGYEAMYVQEMCGEYLSSTEIESRRDVLTRDQIEKDLRNISRSYRKQLPVYRLERAACSAKHYNDDPELWFGDAGVYYRCSMAEYDMTDKDDVFCLVKLEGKNILLAYAEKDWIMDESLFG